MQRRDVLLKTGAGVAVGISGALAGCLGDDDDHPDPTDDDDVDPADDDDTDDEEVHEFEMGVIPTLPNLVLVKPEMGGLLEQYNMSATINEQASGADIVSFIASDDFEMGGGAAGAATLNAIHGGLPVKVVAPLFGQPPDGPGPNPVIVAEDSDIEEMADLEGRPVAINDIGVATGWMLELALNDGGLTLDDVDVRTMPFPDMIPALDEGGIDAGVTITPLDIVADQQVGIRRIHQDYAPGVLVTNLMYNENWAEENPDQARDFMVAYLEGVRDVHDNWTSDENLQIIEELSDVGPEQVEAIGEESAYPHVYQNLEISPDDLQDLQEYLIEHDQVDFDEPLDFDEVVDTTYIDHALDELGEV